MQHSQHGEFLRLLDESPDLFTLVGRVEFTAAYLPERGVQTWYGHTHAFGKGPRWFYADVMPRLQPHSEHPHSLRLEWCPNGDVAARMWRERLHARIDANQFFIEELATSTAPTYVLGFIADEYAEALTELTTLYSLSTGLPAAAARACLLGRLSPRDVQQVTGGTPTTEQVSSYLALGALRAGPQASQWLM